jgi:dTDP-4-dehydrorhamnose 3,5-epimerase
MPSVRSTALPGVLVIEPELFSDARGAFFEAYNQQAFDRAIGGAPRFVQDNQSISHRHVVRGLHYQITQTQAKLVRVLKGEIFDVCVDLRRGSPSFGRWNGLVMSEANRTQLWIPEGFAHGFLVLSDTAEVLYKTTDYYTPSAERTLLWNDPEIGIEWPNTAPAILSAKDAAGTPFRNAEYFS